MNYKILAIVIFVSLVYGYFCGYKSAQAEYEETLRELKADAAQEIIKIEREFMAKRDKIEQDFLVQLDKEKAEYESIKNELKNVKFSNTVKPSRVCKSASGTRVPAKTDDKSYLICYTKDELQRKVTESLDIARECDELAIKYNALLKICKAD